MLFCGVFHEFMNPHSYTVVNHIFKSKSEFEMFFFQYEMESYQSYGMNLFSIEFGQKIYFFKVVAESQGHTIYVNTHKF